MRVSSIGEYIKEQREQAKISLRQLAAAAGVSNPYLSQIERGLRRPSAEILQQIAKGLRISAEALYVQAGILEDRPSDSGVRAAVLAETELTERQKQVLLEIYDSFRKEAAALREQALAEEAESGPGRVSPAQDGPADGVAWATVAGESAAGAAGPAHSAGPAEASGAATAPPGPEEEIDDPLAAPALLNTEEAAGGQPPAPGMSGLPSAGQEG
jgi:transcriptional regulator with XRE-family HTH domain